MGTHLRPVLLHLAILATGLLVVTIGWSLSARTLAGDGAPPARERVTLETGAVVDVEYHTTVSAQTLGLPLYQGATLARGYAYEVAGEGDRPVTLYAFAELTSADAPERVAAWYSDQLPGQPEPEVLGEEGQRRHTISLATNGEVRQVTIAADGEGSRIELIRAQQPRLPPPPRDPEAGEVVA